MRCGCSQEVMNIWGWHWNVHGKEVSRQLPVFKWTELLQVISGKQNHKDTKCTKENSGWIGSPLCGDG